MVLFQNISRPLLPPLRDDDEVFVAPVWVAEALLALPFPLPLTWPLLPRRPGAKESCEEVGNVLCNVSGIMCRLLFSLL